MTTDGIESLLQYGPTGILIWIIIRMEIMNWRITRLERGINGSEIPYTSGDRRRRENRKRAMHIKRDELRNADPDHETSESTVYTNTEEKG